MKLIDADKLLGLMNDPMFKEGFRETMKIIIKNTPTVDAVPVVRGEWIYEPRTFNCNSAFKCSNCGHREYEHDRKTLYCPDCGAKMEDKPCE